MQDKEYYKQYYNNPENKRKRMENNRKWRIKNPERYRELERKSNRKSREKVKQELFKLLGNKCSNPNCAVPNGMTDIRALQIDHIYGRGNQEKRIVNGDKGGSYHRDILRQIKAGSKDYQLLCANCNWIKRHENKETGGGRRIEYE